MYATVKKGGSACSAMSGGRKRRGTKRRGTKRHGTKRRGMKRRHGTKRRGGMSCTKGGGKKRASKKSKSLFARLGL